MFKASLLVAVTAMSFAPAFASDGGAGHGGYKLPKCYTRDAIRIVYFGDSANEALRNCMNFGHPVYSGKTACNVAHCNQGTWLNDGE